MAIPLPSLSCVLILDGWRDDADCMARDRMDDGCALDQAVTGLVFVAASSWRMNVKIAIIFCTCETTNVWLCSLSLLSIGMAVEAICLGNLFC